MPFRRLPNTDATRFSALQTCKLKADDTDAAARPISAENFTKLTAVYGQFKDALGEQAAALSNQTKATSESSTAFNMARQFISHFIQTFNMAVDRNVFPATDRAHYQLDVSGGSLPPLASEADVLLWGDRVIAGEAKRVAAGGTAIPFPSIAEVSGAFDNFKAKRAVKSQRSEVMDADEEAVAALRPDVDALVLDLWEEIEFAFRRQPAASLRNKAREWGVVYESRPGEPVDPPAPTPTPPTPPPTN